MKSGSEEKHLHVCGTTDMNRLLGSRDSPRQGHGSAFVFFEEALKVGRGVLIRAPIFSDLVKTQ